MIALLVVTDGRLDYLTRTMESATANLRGPITERWMYDDTGDECHRSQLREMFPDFHHFDAGPRQGFGGAIQSAWRQLVAQSESRFVFHLEQDFTFNRPVDLLAMAEVLDWNPSVVQVALRRQPWNDAEKAAGGVVEQHPDDYEAEYLWGYHETSWGAPDPRVRPVLLHRRFFTTNPSLYRIGLCRRGWPTVKHSEGVFTHQIIEDPAVRFAFWGERTDDPWVEHIGTDRVGTGY